mmetsp:Transcript_12965/g.31599  ORF Transcript_12965/g.31599 Transcript_12965/m.31599 type:complete len:237 (+) Transcript_12965:4288-4998(+)
MELRLLPAAAAVRPRFSQRKAPRLVSANKRSFLFLHAAPTLPMLTKDKKGARRRPRRAGKSSVRATKNRTARSRTTLMMATTRSGTRTRRRRILPGRRVPAGRNHRRGASRSPGSSVITTTTRIIGPTAKRTTRITTSTATGSMAAIQIGLQRGASGEMGVGRKALGIGRVKTTATSTLCGTPGAKVANGYREGHRRAVAEGRQADTHRRERGAGKAREAGTSTSPRRTRALPNNG